MNFAALVWQTGAVIALGGGAFLQRAGAPPAILTAWLVRVWLMIACCTLLAWGAGVWVLAQEGSRIVGHSLAFDAPEWKVLLTRTRFGQVWALKQILLTCLVVATVLRARGIMGSGGVPQVLAALFLVVGLWAGHGGATVPVVLNLPLHAAHVLAAALWLGGLPLWAWLVCRLGDTDGERQYLARAITRFSQVATAMMGVLLVSGSWIAVQQFQRWPALFGTYPGALLIFKLGLLVIALGMAWRLRQRFLDRLAKPHAPALRGAALRHIAVEMLAAGGVFAFAIELARTTPGAHQAITWWWPFRFAPGAAWTEATARWQTVAGIALASCAVPAWAWRHPRTAAAALIGGGAIIAYALAIPAFPDTYRRPTVPYTARAIHEGAALFTQHCVTCHGAGARGDGRPPAEGIAPAADLSEHTALHTAGDMFWWLTHGTPTGNMPGFETVLTEQQRWSVINFLRAFADGHRARVLSPDVVPNRPWLGAPNFQFETLAGNSGELKDYRDTQPVLLVLARLPASGSRLQSLALQAPRLRETGLRIITVMPEGACGKDPLLTSTLDCVTLGARDTAFAYRLLARTLGVPGSRHLLAPEVDHAEFLIDRFGYLRARWLPAADATGWPAQDDLLARVRQLVGEPQVLESPDEHVH